MWMETDKQHIEPKAEPQDLGLFFSFLSYLVLSSLLYFSCSFALRIYIRSNPSKANAYF